MTTDELASLIGKGFKGAEVYVKDLTGDGNHFEAWVVAQEFENQNRIARHQSVMNTVRSLLDGPLHALTIKTYTPNDWKKEI